MEALLAVNSVDSGVSVGPSQLGGLGLFVNKDIDGEILRIGREHTYSIYTCLELSKKIKDQTEPPVIKSLLGFYCNGLPNETRILICYMIGFEVLRRLGKLEGYKELQQYLNVLLRTEIGNLWQDEEPLLESYYELEPGNSLVNATLLEKQSGEVSELSRFISETWRVTFEEHAIQQLVAAVRSRTLEVPRKVSDDDDFSVDVTLVPLLDFANHDNSKQNAYFDLDPKTDEIVLLAKRPLSGGSEVLISYTPVEEMTRMFITYGFYPRSDGLKVVDVPFWGYHHFDRSEELAQYVFQQRQPTNLQFVLEYADGQLVDLFLNMASNYSFAGLIGPDDVPTVMENASEEQIDGALSTLLELVESYFAERVERAQEFAKFCDDYEAENGTKNIRQLVQFHLELYNKYLDKMRQIAPRAGSESLYDLVMVDGDDWVEHRLPPVYNFLTRELARH
ncbi:hypothetical protein KL946_000391 [Ogataea haglerorum]|uniref:SET domain-containing protein n=1 Tax=Ogataea haglerorum TaxID=1937702 RepID=A0ABQ7RNE3_9ASCO|nr:hypothetical protein KL946_000391 [Ogataea haglerorum]